MNKEEYKARVDELRSKINYYESEIKKLKEESDALTFAVMNEELEKDLNPLTEEEKVQIETLEKNILDYDTNRKSSFIAKAIDTKNIKVFASLNDMNEADEKSIKDAIDALLVKLVTDDVDHGYIDSLETARKCSHIVNGLSTFSMVVIVAEKTYAFAEGRSNIYTYYGGMIKKFELTNILGELNYEVLNNDDYSKLVLLSKSDSQDLTDDKVKIITNQTNRDSLAHELL